jgi:circadian clock protein KaiB
MIDGPEGVVRFRLYIAGQAHNSQRAVANLNAFCVAHLAGRHVIDVVDVLEQPELALQDRIFLTPQLIIASPLPVRTIIGDLSNSADLSRSLSNA